MTGHATPDHVADYIAACKESIRFYWPQRHRGAAYAIRLDIRKIRAAQKATQS